MLAASRTLGVVSSFEALRKRVDRLFYGSVLGKKDKQLGLALEDVNPIRAPFVTGNVGDFMDFVSSVLPDGDAYLFGGVVRDLALFGKRAFDSDIDVVIDGDFLRLTSILSRLGAKKNKFGGFRLQVGDWPVDVWAAEDTWAVRKGLVEYRGVASLTKTTVLNWDAVLMAWRSKKFICSTDYLGVLSSRTLDIVLMENPSPRGMAVRVFRHMSQKSARKIGISAFKYLEAVTAEFSFEELRRHELASYGGSLIDPLMFEFFRFARDRKGDEVERYRAAVSWFEENRYEVSLRQIQFELDDLRGA